MIPLLGIKIVAYDIQNAPKDVNVVAPNVFPLGNSHMPAMNCARPPQNMAIPTTALGATMCRAPALYSESIKVVDANEKRPREPGLAIFEEPVAEVMSNA